jgi:hypothetical protein
MLFMQPVVVNDAPVADRALAAEVRIVERRALEQPRWNGTMLAQGPMDQRSPFGNNAPDMNDLTPTPRMVNPPTSAQTAPADSMSNTKIPPPQGQPDAGPPPPAGGTTTTPGTAPAGTGTPGGTLGETPNASRSSAAPSTPSGMPDRNPTGVEPGATIPGTSTPAPLPVPAPPPSSSSTLPGASSGASNTR